MQATVEAGAPEGGTSASSRSTLLSGAWQDCLLLTFVVGIWFAPYLGRLGFYSDDWAYLGSLRSFGDFSNAGRSAAFNFAEAFHQRPTQAFLVRMLFRAFGLEPLGYYVVDAIIFVAMAVFLYLVLRELRLPRVPSLAIPTIFVLLPNYSSVRFWPITFSYQLSMAAYFFSLFANIRALRGTRHSYWGWGLLGITALVVSGLGIELALPLFVANLGLLWYLWRTREGRADIAELSKARLILLLGGNLAALILVVAYKSVTSVQTGISGSYVRHVARIATGSIAMNFGSDGLDLPLALRWSLRQVGPMVIAAVILLSLVVFIYLILLGRRTRPLDRRGSKRLMGAGVAVFALGYAIFLTNDRILFTSTGPNNRVAIAASVGVAMIAYGVVGWVSSWLRSVAWRAFVVSLLTAGLCLSGFLMNSGLAESWSQSWARQRQILADIRSHVPPPPPHSALILDGTCPYIGPAMVFESNWDLSGALEVIYQDPTIRADVTSDHLEVGDQGLRTTIFGDHHTFYPYGDRLFVYDITRTEVVPLRDAQSARRYFAGNESRRSFCLRGFAGIGVPILPMDERFWQLERRYLVG